MELFRAGTTSPREKLNTPFQLKIETILEYRKNSTSKNLEPVRKTVTILLFEYGLRKRQINFRPLCDLNFDCIFINDDTYTVRNWSNYTAIMVSGTPGLQRLSMVVKQYVTEKRDPRQIWIARGKESSISGLNFGGKKGMVSSTLNL